MAILFPNIAPTSRSFRPPVWPTTEKRAQAGVTSVRLWGSKPTDGSLSLGFTNIRDSLAAQIIATWNQAKGHVLPLELSPSVLKGMEQELQAACLDLISEASLTWHFTKNEPPTVDSVKRGISNVRVTLVAELRLK